VKIKGLKCRFILLLNIKHRKIMPIIAKVKFNLCFFYNNVLCNKFKFFLAKSTYHQILKQFSTPQIVSIKNLEFWFFLVKRKFDANSHSFFFCSDCFLQVRLWNSGEFPFFSSKYFLYGPRYSANTYLIIYHIHESLIN
jgi:hypothetical protein